MNYQNQPWFNPFNECRCQRVRDIEVIFCVCFFFKKLNTRLVDVHISYELFFVSINISERDIESF